jgi:hypothetical protein
LQHQALEHLLAQHVLRRQLDVLLLQALRDQHQLLVELALQHHAIVHGGRDTIEQLAARAQIARLRGSERGGECQQCGDRRANRERARKRHDSPTKYLFNQVLRR